MLFDAVQLVHVACIFYTVIEFIPAELKSRLCQMREQDEHVQSMSVCLAHAHTYTCMSLLCVLQIKGEYRHY